MRSDQLPASFASSMVVFLLLGAGGLVALALTWRGVAAQVLVAEQVPYIASGGIGGLAMIGFSVGGMLIQSRRLVEGRRRAELDELILASERLVDAVREGLAK